MKDASKSQNITMLFHPESDSVIDLDTLKSRVKELDGITERTAEQNTELAAHYAAWAVTLYNTGEEDEEGDLDDIQELLQKAETLYTNILRQADSPDTRQQLGNVYLEWGVILNDYDEMTDAIDAYKKAIQTLKPLSEQGDGDAKYDIAGLNLNLGIAYRELGELDEAKASLDEAFTGYRAVEKICASDTRLYMAIVSVQQGNVLHEMNEPLESVVDAYNRAMRLYVEVIEDLSRPDLERDLASVLIDRSVAVYENWAGTKFENEEKRKQAVDEVLLDIRRGVDLLEKHRGTDDDPHDLFYAVSLLGRVLCDAEYFDEAKLVLDRAIEEIEGADNQEEFLLMQTAMAYATRAIVQIGLGNKEKSEQDCMKGSELINQFLQAEGEDDDEDVQELKLQFQAMLEALAETEDAEQG